MFLTPVEETTRQSRIPVGLSGPWYGVYPALVADINDPDGQGRVKITLPWSPDSGADRYEAWARLSTLMAGNKKGSWFVPDVNDEVLVAFESGDARRPYVIGALWTGRDEAPGSMDGAGNNDKKILRSRNGVTITLDDKDGQEQLTLETPGGQKLTMKDGPGTIELRDANGNTVKLESSGITITASARVQINASQVSISSGMISIVAGMVKCSGVLKADTVIANSVVSSSYTPGAGNIW